MTVEEKDCACPVHLPRLHIFRVHVFGLISVRKLSAAKTCEHCLVFTQNMLSILLQIIPSTVIARVRRRLSITL
jgi:hypothetical protein